MVTVFKRTNDK